MLLFFGFFRFWQKKYCAFWKFCVLFSPRVHLALFPPPACRALPPPSPAVLTPLALQFGAAAAPPPPATAAQLAALSCGAPPTPNPGPTAPAAGTSSVVLALIVAVATRRAFAGRVPACHVPSPRDWQVGDGGVLFFVLLCFFLVYLFFLSRFSRVHERGCVPRPPPLRSSLHHTLSRPHLHSPPNLQMVDICTCQLFFSLQLPGRRWGQKGAWQRFWPPSSPSAYCTGELRQLAPSGCLLCASPPSFFSCWVFGFFPALV